FTKTPSVTAAQEALGAALRRRGVSGEVEVLFPGRYRIHYGIQGQPLISIIIPTKDKVDLLSRCVLSILDKSTYRNFEILIIDNNSIEDSTKQYLSRITEPHRVIPYPGSFNWSTINNL